MAITILDYVKSVVGDKDLYTAEDCLASGVDILGGCQGCHASIAAYNAYPSTSGYWRCADCIGDDGYATVADFTAHDDRDRDLPGLRQHRQHQRDPRHHRRAHRRVRRSNAVTAARSGSHEHRLPLLNGSTPPSTLAAARPSTAISASARCSRSKAPWTQARRCTSALADYDDPLRWWL